MPWDNELALAKRATTVAAEYLEERHTSLAEMDELDWRDIKLEADRKSEDLILTTLTNANPYPVLAEESGEYDLNTDNTPFWIVDPLDGSLNFRRGIPFYCISIALWQGRKPILGVVHSVLSNEQFSGVVGWGAWCNDQVISVSEIASPQEAILATGFPVHRDFRSEPLQRFLREIQSFKKIRLLGSAALSLAYLAAGRVDAYYEEGIMLWDVAAGVALVKAAGGWVELHDSDRHKLARDVACATRQSTFPVEHFRQP